MSDESKLLERKGWPVIRRANSRSRCPWGYYKDPDDKFVWRPDQNLVLLAEKAMDFLDQGNSLRETAAWLEAQAGIACSHMTLNNMWKRNRGTDKSPRTAKLKKYKKTARARTKAEKEAYDLARKKSTLKRQATLLAKKEAKLKGAQEQVEADVDAGSEEAVPAFVAKAPDSDLNQEIIFKPNDGPQYDFLAATEKVCLFGGSAGGGKSYALLADPMRYFDNKNFNGIFFRRTNDELRDVINEAQDLYQKAFPGTVWQEKKSQFKFPSGARFWFTYLEQDKDVKRYQGQAFNYIAWDELTQHPTPYAFNYMLSRNRTTDPTLPTYIRAATNPGSAGHWWVKKMFIDPAPANTPFWAIDIENGNTIVYPKKYPIGHPKAGQPHPKAGVPLRRMRFIPASLYDNPHLLQNEEYEQSLLSLPEKERRQLLEGDWDVAEGAAFPEFHKSDHVTAPFEIPESWRRFRSCDFGYSSHSAVHWYAIDPHYETLYVYRELYVSKHTARDLALAVLDAERGEKIDYGVLDSSCWHQRGQLGPSIAEEMIATGCRWRPSDRSGGSRVASKNRLHELLKPQDIGDGNTRPGIVFFDSCRQIIADLPVIPSDPKGSDDIDVRHPTDHAYDSIRYGIQSRPRSSSFFDSFGSQQTSYTPVDPTFGY